MYVRDLKRLTGVDSEFATCAACGAKQWAYGLSVTDQPGVFRAQEVPSGSIVCNEHAALLHPEEAVAIRERLAAVQAKRREKAAPIVDVEVEGLQEWQVAPRSKVRRHRGD